MNFPYKKSLISILFALGLVASVLPKAEAIVTSACIMNSGTSSCSANPVVSAETVGTSTGAIVHFVIDSSGTVEIDIYRLQNISEVPSASNLIAAIQQNGLAGVPSGTAYNYFWNALWLLGGDLGRQGGDFLYQFIVTSNGSNPFTIQEFLRITSVDIHNVSVTPSIDANQSPAFPYIIRYSLAKDSLVTVLIKDSLGNTVRTMVNNFPQYGESVAPIMLRWNGLNDSGRPVPLGVYNVTFDARDPLSTDVAFTRTRTISVTSLANLEADPQTIFEANTFVYPNPVRNDQATFTALAVRNNANIYLKIYTLAGDLVREESFKNLITAQQVTLSWDATNKAGKKVGRGLYYFVVREEDPEGTLQTTKKVAVIR